MQTQIHKIIKTDANVCLTNSENKYTYKSDKKTTEGSCIIQTPSASTERMTADR